LIEVDDNDVFMELLKEEKEPWLLIEDESHSKNIQVFKLNDIQPVIFTAKSLEELKEKSNIIYKFFFLKYFLKLLIFMYF